MTVLPWQHADWANLRSYMTQQRIPQALLMIGAKGIGKQPLANQFGAALLCCAPNADGLACGRCVSCALIVAGNHPDWLSLAPEEPGKSIAIEQIRALLVTLSLKPQFDRYRIVSINPADALNDRAANAFLKCLEEPAERTVFLLLTDQPHTLPPTLLSRCQKFPLRPVDTSGAIAWLSNQQPEVPVADWPKLLAMAQQAPFAALAYARQGLLGKRKQCLQDWLALAKRQTHPVLVAEAWLGVPEHPLWFWLTTWVIDLLRCRLYSAPNLANPDLLAFFQPLAQRVDVVRLFGLYDLMLAARQRLASTANKQVLLEEILIVWSELTHLA